MTRTLSMEIEPFVDASRAAQFLSITRRRVLDMARAGLLPAHPFGGGRRRIWRFRLSELAESVATHSHQRSIINAGGLLAVPKGKGR